MREDHKDLVINIGRRGQGDREAPRRRMSERDAIAHRCADDLPTQLAMGKGVLDRNSPSDRFGPLRRMLASNVGRPWDKVYSEIKQTSDVRGLRGWHFVGHVFDFVTPQNGKSDPSRRFRDFYVDDHGMLRKSEERKRRRYPASYYTTPGVHKLTQNLWVVTTPVGTFEITTEDWKPTPVTYVDPRGRPYTYTPFAPPQSAHALWLDKFGIMPKEFSRKVIVNKRQMSKKDALALVS